MRADDQGSVGFEDVPEPTRTAGDLLMEVAAYSVNRGEVLKLADRSWAPGKDVAGTVVDGGADGPPAGTRVVAHLDGAGWAERALVARGTWARVPEDVDLVAAAALPLAGLTALRLLGRVGDLTGRSLLVTGAAGGVGHYLTELAVSAGAQVTALVSTEERGARLRELGARTITDLEQADHRYDVGLDALGGPSLAGVRHRTRADGLVLWFGQVAGPATIDFFDWVEGGTGAPIEQFHYARPRRPGDTDGGDLITLVRLVHEGRLHPELGSVRPWSETAAGIDDLRHRRVRGNLVLTLP